MMYSGKDFLWLAILASLYALLAQAGMAFIVHDDIASLMYFPSGLALAALLIGGKKYWPGIFMGAYWANILADHTVPVSLVVASGHTLEPLLAAWWLISAKRFDVSLRRKQDFMQLMLAGMISPVISATLGVAASFAGSVVGWGKAPVSLLQWWMGDMFGILLVAPAILIWRQPQMNWFRRERAGEFAILLGLAFLCGQVIFFDWWRDASGLYAEEYLMFIFVVWAGVRFGRHGVLLVIMLALTQAWLGMSHGVGYFGRDISRIGMARFWVYFVELAAIGLALATVIREKNDTKEAVAESEVRFRSMFHKHGSVMLLIDPESGQIVDANQAAADFYGYSEQRLREMAVSQINNLPREETFAVMKRALQEEQKQFCFTHRLANGEARIVDVYSSPIEVSGRMLLFSIIMDITENKKLEQELEKRANTDPLTGLPNRRCFMELAEQELARSIRYEKPFSLLLLDVDYFKKINDTHGHKAGDLALQALAGQCRSTLREVDVTGRFGGEEFAVILPETSIEQAGEVAERLRQEIAVMRIGLNDGEVLQLTVSVGVSALYSFASSMDELLQQADKALYTAKQEGRNRVCLLSEPADTSGNLQLFTDLAVDAG